MTKPPLIRVVRVMESSTLEIDCSTGETLPSDISRLLTRFKLYAPLKKAKVFARATADAWGHSVNWPGDIDIGADVLYDLARVQAGEWGSDAFNAWMERNGLSLNGAADALDMTRRMIAHYRSGSRPIPRVVALACEGWEARQRQHAA